jgi:uncharacterized protein
VTCEYRSNIGAPLDRVFAYHQRQGALFRLLPPWIPARVDVQADSLQDGVSVLRLPGRVRWTARHRPTGHPYQFIDELVSLPFRWHHTHSFTYVRDDTTEVLDEVDTSIPCRLLRPMFRYRQDQLAGDLAAHNATAELIVERELSPVLTVAMTGTSGLVGSALSALLSTGGHRVVHLVRRTARGPIERRWDPADPDPHLFDDIDAVVHLAGEPIAGRFTNRHKDSIAASRIVPTEALARAIIGCADPPKTLIVASAIGYYGRDRGDEILSESSPRGTGFLADLVGDWEAASFPARTTGVRVVNIRTGIVQSPRGGVLSVFRPLFAGGVGGPLGDGKQWMSWIDLDDLCDIYYRALVDTAMEGPVNGVAPQPVSNGEYSATLARVLRRPAVLRVPALAPRLLLGSEGARELALASQRVLPQRLQQDGHRFRWPTIEACLRHQLGRFPEISTETGI